MTLSIITVNYNDAVGLRRTLDSVRRQTCKEFEYIVVDGASADGSREVMAEYGDVVTCPISEKDTGVFNAMNKGIAKANGDYCLFLNSGDYLASDDVVAKVLPCLDGTDFISGDTILVQPQGKQPLWPAPRVLTAYVIVRYSLSHQSTFIRTELLKKRPYREDLRIASDWEQELYELVFHDATYKCIPFPVSYFYEDGISRTDLEGVKRERTKVYSEYFSERMLRSVLGDNELKELCNHLEEGSMAYRISLISQKIARKAATLLTWKR